MHGENMKLSIRIDVCNLTCACVYTSYDIKYTDNNRESLQNSVGRDGVVIIANSTG